MKKFMLAFSGLGLCAVLGCGGSSESSLTASRKSTEPSSLAAEKSATEASNAGPSRSAPAFTSSELPNARTRSDSTTPTTGVGSASPPRTVTIPDGLPPEQIAQRFMESLRSGDDLTVTALLSAKAREEIAKVDGLAIRPPGTPTTRYQVGQTQRENQWAKVPVLLTDEDPETAEKFEVEMTWILREDPAQWRVVGMIGPLAGRPVFFNFENPQEMVSKWETEVERLAREQSASDGSSSGAQARGPAANQGQTTPNGQTPSSTATPQGRAAANTPARPAAPIR